VAEPEGPGAGGSAGDEDRAAGGWPLRRRGGRGEAGGGDGGGHGGSHARRGRWRNRQGEKTVIGSSFILDCDTTCEFLRPHAFLSLHLSVFVLIRSFRLFDEAICVGKTTVT
jgi:hypothetical protein